MNVIVSLFLIICSYLLGSIPTGYLAARLLKGIDLREYGSGTVSASMVWEHVSRWVLFPVGIFDIFKAALPTWLGLELGLGDTVAAAAGLAAVLGHNWPIYLGFTGGRGLSPFLGVLLVLFPWGFVWLVAFLGIGFALGDSAPWALIGLATMPILVYYSGGPAVIYWAILLMLLITLAKRIEANRRPLPKDGKEKRDVFLRRLLFDRDIASHKDWLDRKPE